MSHTLMRVFTLWRESASDLMAIKMMNRIENRTFDELKIGETATLVHTLTFKDVEIFAAMSGDVKGLSRNKCGRAPIGNRCETQYYERLMIYLLCDEP